MGKRCSPNLWVFFLVALVSSMLKLSSLKPSKYTRWILASIGRLVTVSCEVFLSFGFHHDCCSYTAVQNCRQEVFTRGFYVHVGGLCGCSWGLDIEKLIKPPMIYSVSFFDLGGLSSLLISKWALRFQRALSVRAFSLCAWRRWEAVSCAWWEQLQWSDLTRSSLKL